MKHTQLFATSVFTPGSIGFGNAANAQTNMNISILIPQNAHSTR